LSKSANFVKEFATNPKFCVFLPFKNETYLAVYNCYCC